jgi:GTP pyrophosphokinase
VDQADGLAAGTAWEKLTCAAAVALEVPQTSALGTGFVLAPGVVVTCAHLLGDDASALPDRVEGVAVLSGRRIILDVHADRFFRSKAGLDLALLDITGNGKDIPYVLPHAELTIGDPLWTYGHPDGMFRAGQSATFTFEGESRRDTGDELRLLRLRGTPVGGGFSGSPVVNQRTGAVCGMLCTSDRTGSAHMLPIDEIVRRCEPASALHQAPGIAHRRWLSLLTDGQLKAGGWLFAGPRLRAYLDAAVKAAQAHSYANVVTDDRPPKLTEVYVHQHTRMEQGGESDAEFVARMLSADVVFERADDSFLIGAPGAGKSSLLRAAVISLVDRVRQEAASSVPVRVLAADLVPARPLPEAIAHSARTDLSPFGLQESWQPEFFADPPLPDCRWLVLVDGLDEVMDIEQRKAVITKVSSAPSDRYQFVVATRPWSYLAKPEWKAARYELLDFDDDQYVQFAVRWFTFLGLSDPAGQALRFIDQIKIADLDDFARTPLVATMLCKIFAADRQAALPASRATLYESFVDLVQAPLYHAIRGIRPQLTRLLAPYGSDAEQAAEALVTQAADLIGFVAWSRQQDAMARPIELLTARTADLRPAQVPHRTWDSLLRELSRRSGLLTEHGPDFRFLHQTIEEYLAARFVGNDIELSTREVSVLFGSAAAARRTSTARQSYARFLVAIWGAHSDLEPNLTRVAQDGGADGLRFLAVLAADGFPLNPTLLRTVVDGLAREAVDPMTVEFDRRSAVEALVPMDRERGIKVLTSSITDWNLASDHRMWAVVKLARLLRGAGEDTWEDIGQLQRAMRVLAEAPMPVLLDALSDIATDPALSDTQRLWAADALATADRQRGTRAMKALAKDTSATATIRERAVELLAELRDPVRARLERMIKSARSAPQVWPALEPIVTVHRRHHPKAAIELLERAFDFADRQHIGQRRASGDPYITHPMAVASILAELGMDTETLAAGLLHGVVEHTSCTLVELLQVFDKPVTALVDGVTELDRTELGTAAEPETLRKLIIAGARDPRVLVLKVADRLHNLRTMRHLPPEQQAKRARDTLEIIAPLARRLGMNLADELEDLSFAVLQPKQFDETVRLVAKITPSRESMLQTVTEQLASRFRESNIAAEISSVPRTYYTVYQRMLVRGADAAPATDDVRLVVIVPRVTDCYAALGVVHYLWAPRDGRVADFITQPQFGIYQSLHTTVIGPHGQPLEIRLRTSTMHEKAEYGIVMRWRRDDSSSDEMAWMRHLMDWQRETADPEEFLDQLRFDLAAPELFVFDQKGDVLTLPVGSTPVDFAYAVDTDAGHRFAGARVNGRLVAPERTLNSGDVVEIFTSTAPSARPSSEWLGFVASPKARAKIKQYIEGDTRPKVIEVDSSARRGVTVEIHRLLDERIEIVSMTVTTTDQISHSEFVTATADAAALAQAVQAIRGIDGVHEVRLRDDES